MPRGIIVSMSLLIVTGAVVLFLAPGAAGSAAMATSGNPLVEALGDGGMLVNYIGLAGLIASFFSIMYAYSRADVRAVSGGVSAHRACRSPTPRKAPMLALIVPGVIGFALSLTGQGATR